MKKVLLILLFSTFFYQANAEEFSSDKQFHNWPTYYYQKPHPEQVIPFLQWMDKKGLLSDKAARPPMIAFFSIIFHDNPKLLPQWMEEFNNLGPDTRKMCWLALQYSYSELATDYFKRMLTEVSDEDKPFIAKILTTDAPSILESEIHYVYQLDMLWGCFLASGDTRYVDKIIDALPMMKDESDQRRTLIGLAARWSLTSNAKQHKVVLKFCKKRLANSSKELKPLLEEVIKKALEPSSAEE